MPAGLAALVGSQTTVTGVARNAHAGAVVLTADRTPVYIDGRESWDETDLDGTKVDVTGVLRRRSIVPKATVEADGAVSHGMDDDDVFVIADPSWSAAKGD